MTRRYPVSTLEILTRLKDDPAALNDELQALRDALPYVVALIEADRELDRLHFHDPDDPMSDGERQDRMEAQRYRRGDALKALTALHE